MVAVQALEVPFPDAVLRSNYSPFPNDVPRIQTFVAEAKSLLESSLPNGFYLTSSPSSGKSISKYVVSDPPKRLGNHGRKGRKLRKYLVQVRDDLERLVQEHEALLSPIRRLPPELLEEVFHHVMNISHEDTSTSSYPNENSPIMVLCRTSRHWRSIAESAPRLWCSIRMTNISKENWSRKRVLLRRCLERSGSCPLSLHLSFSDCDMQKRSFDTIFSVAGPTSSRWRQLRFEFPNGILQHVHHALQSLGTLPSLQYLDFSDKYDGYRCCGDPENLDISASGPLPIPALRKLSVTHSGNLDSFLSHFPIAQLTHLSLTQTFYSNNSSFDDVFERLSKLPNLTHLDISLNIEDDLEHYAMVELVNVVYLTVRYSQTWKACLAALILPRLEHVRLVGFQSYEAYADTFTEFVGRSMRSFVNMKVDAQSCQVDVDLGEVIG